MILDEILAQKRRKGAASVPRIKAEIAIVEVA